MSTAPSTCPPGGGSAVYTRAHFWRAEEGQAVNGAPIASSADAQSEARADADGEQGLLVYPARHLDSRASSKEIAVARAQRRLVNQAFGGRLHGSLFIFLSSKCLGLLNRRLSGPELL